ncbi:hypothetical protein [Synechocystis sp. LEGE 06083]|uniref:hypothetical protein n=1 Tax=Synechocystis sp. LEGE 06083 TaxID=915336 RepID=UPI00187F1E72|nr:hypothetical protein [Synechocystis sp. LEGE 06083]
MDAGRDPDYFKNHLLSYTAHDFIETSMMSLTCIREGIHNPVIREMRSLLESSIKLSYIQQKDYKLPIAEKVLKFRSELADHKISRMREIKFHFLSEDSSRLFLEDVGRIYGLTSKYIHYSADVIQERIARVDEGRTGGKESPDDINSITDVIQKAMAQSIVFISHAVPQYVMGDYLVNPESPFFDWHFLKYRFIAEIDAGLDYKAERQKSLAEIQGKRSTNVEF